MTIKTRATSRSPCWRRAWAVRPDRQTPGLAGAEILLQKYVVSSNTLVDANDANWHTVVSQAVTVAGATDRVFVDASLTLKATGSSFTCNMRIARGTTAVATATGHIEFNNQQQHFTIKGIDAPGTGDHTYNVQVQRVSTNDCEANPDSNSSFAAVEVLSANP